MYDFFHVKVERNIGPSSRIGCKEETTDLERCGTDASPNKWERSSILQLTVKGFFRRSAWDVALALMSNCERLRLVFARQP